MIFISEIPFYHCRNLAISKKRINLANDRLCSAINNLDSASLNPEYVDILLRFIPTDDDKKKYRGIDAISGLRFELDSLALIN